MLGALQGAISGETRDVETRNALRRVLIAGTGVAGIAEAAAEVLGSPVAILDEYLDVLGTSDLTDARQESLVDAIEEARTHGPASLLGPFIQAGVKGAGIMRLDGAEGSGL